MLPKKWRLSRDEFQQVRKDGSVHSGEYAGVLILSPADAQSLNTTKAGIIVSKKLLAHAVDRNTAKRKLRAALQLVLPTLHSPLWLVVLPNRRATGATVAELEKDIEHIVNGKS